MAVLPQEMVTLVGRAYNRGTKHLASKSIQNEESIEVVLASAAHTWFWKPPHVKTLLLANFRKITLPGELAHRCKVQWAKVGSDCPPDSFLRIPYCLAYGEPALVPSLNSESNQCPTHHWDLLGELVEMGELPLEADLTDRLAWKFKTLSRLRERGIWVLSSSHFPEVRDIETTSIWWENVGSTAWKEEGEPTIIAYGQEHYHRLKELQIPVEDWLYQPIHRNSEPAKKHHTKTIKTIHQLCTNH